MDQTSKGDLSVDWTTQLERWPCTDKTTTALQKLPRVRELTLRPRRLDLKPKSKNMNFKPKKNHEAALGQICGELALAACLRCANGKGPFVECVVVNGLFAKACCNCHYSSQGLSCSFRDTESVRTVSTPNGLNATGNALDEQAKPIEMADSQSGPQVSQSDSKSISTRLRSKKEDLQKPPTPKEDFASPRVAVDLTVNEPPSRKRQRQEATITGLALERSQPEQGIDGVRQPSEETIQCLREEIQRLRREKSEQQARQTALIKGFVTCAAVVEIAVDVRGAELRCGLSDMGGTPEETQEQAQQMIHFSNATSRHVSSLVHYMLEEQQVFLNDDQQKTMRLGYASAQPSEAVKVVLDQRLPFMIGPSEK